MKCLISLTVVVFIITLCYSSPLKDNSNDDEEEYDQRQNGSENYRINVDGVVIAIAPADEVLSAVSNLDLNDVIQLTDDSLGPQIHKESSKPVITLLSSSNGAKPSNNDNSQIGAETKTAGDQNSKNRLGQRLISIIKPFLRRGNFKSH